MEKDAARRLQELEESLWRPQTRYDEAWMRRVLHPEFLEFGRSGRVYDLAASLVVEPGAFEAELPLPGFAVTEPAPGVALATYVSRVRYDEGVLAANRSSLWIRDGAVWRLRFHQGTPV
ncbi:DUF4440 domain-containing protein [Amnibacterium sp.]|uniref:nuclear transport factor 2 family protein n=1 Tax=Amnibacterium sp. TaxID=1872496 RepID=UPI00262BF289|nr:DUF4440 domain-containing protein [Amnibacterium sp.]MCU1472795.1 hypothetical protein [Amnibacterium sp.]